MDSCHVSSTTDNSDLLRPSGLQDFVTLHTWNPPKWIFPESQICQHVSPGNQRPRSTFTLELWIFHHLSLWMMDGPWPLRDFGESSLLCENTSLKLVHLSQIQRSGMIPLPPGWILADGLWNLRRFTPFEYFSFLSLLRFISHTLRIRRGFLQHLVELRLCALLAANSCARISFLRAIVHALKEFLCTPCKWEFHYLLWAYELEQTLSLLAIGSHARLEFLWATVHTLQQSLYTPCK